MKKVINIFLLCFVLVTFKTYGDEEKRWSSLSLYQFDIDNDNVEETLVLEIYAEKDEAGNILHDHGENWRVIIKKNNSITILYEEFITNGNLYIGICNKTQQGEGFILLIIDTVDAFDVKKIAYDKITEKYSIIPIISCEKSFPHLIFKSIGDADTDAELKIILEKWPELPMNRAEKK